MTKKLLKNKFFLGGLVLVIIAAAITAFFQFRSTPERTIAQFGKAYADKNVNAMVKCFPPSDQALMAGLLTLDAEFTNGESFVFVSFVADEAEVEGEEPVSGVATLMLLNEFGEPGTRTDSSRFFMEKIDGQWYLSAF